MASQYTTSLKIQEINPGEQSGVWGNTTNTNWTLIEQAVAGVINIAMSNADYTLSSLNGVADEARNMVLNVTGTNSAIYKVVAPLVSKFYVISNNTTGGYAITIGASTGSVITIPNGTTAQVYCDGSTGFFSAQTGSAGNFSVNGNLTVIGTTTMTGSLSASTATFSGAISSVSPSFTGTPTAPTASSGTNTTQIATTAFVVANAVLTGALLMWPTTSAPSGYLLCNGTAVSRTTYSDLYAVIGTTFGAGDGSTTFNLPNYADRMPIGTGTIATGIGSSGGSSSVTLSISNLPSHNHGVNDPGHYHTPNLANGGGGFGNDVANYVTNSQGNTSSTGPALNSAYTGITTQNTGSGASITTISPYLGINFIIKT